MQTVPKSIYCHICIHAGHICIYGVCKIYIYVIYIDFLCLFVYIYALWVLHMCKWVQIGANACLVAHHQLCKPNYVSQDYLTWARKFTTKQKQSTLRQLLSLLNLFYKFCLAPCSPAKHRSRWHLYHKVTSYTQGYARGLPYTKQITGTRQIMYFNPCLNKPRKLARW